MCVPDSTWCAVASVGVGRGEGDGATVACKGVRFGYDRMKRCVFLDTIG